jgi:signal transduction histidine kinase
MTDNIQNQQQNIFTNEKDITATMYKEFIANMLLNVKAPCTGIWAQSLVLSYAEDNPSKKSSICAIANCAKELIEYSDDIIDFANSHFSMPPTMFKEFVFRKLVNRVITTLKPLSDNKGFRLVENTHSETPKFIIGDSYRLEAILHHLITNSINFAREDSFCGVTSQLFYPRATESNANDNAVNNSAMLQIIVHDTGIGMSEETRQYLYQQLTNLDSTSATDEEDIDREDATIDTESPVKLGFGLSLMKKFIRELQGKIELSSKEGKSTTFTLQIPVKVP